MDERLFVSQQILSYADSYEELAEVEIVACDGVKCWFLVKNILL